MSAQPDHIRLQPKRFPAERVKVDFRKLLSSMGQALTHGTFAFFAPEPATAAGAAVNAGAAIFGAVEALEADAPLEVRAWYLLRAALATALGQLLGELHERRGPFQGDLEHLDTRLDLLLEGNDAVIDGNFLDNPRTLKLLPQIRRVLEGWLATKVGLSVGDARSLALRLGTHLAPALRAESRAHRDYYKPIYAHFEDRFAYAAQMEWDWEQNRLALIQQFEDPVFEETFGLRQVYVPLRAYTIETTENEKPSRGVREQRCRIFMLADEIDAWLNHGPKVGDAIRLITGGPGSGKSSFAKWLGAELSERRRMRVLFIPLQRFRVQANLKEAIASYLTETKRFQQSPLAQDGFATPRDPLLLIFDGLDELTKPGDLADEQTKLFIEELRHHLGLWNEGGVKVLALITGRTVYAQAKRPLLRISDRQEVAVLPYLIDEDRKRELCGAHEVSSEDLLEEDQRERWWRNYGLAKGLNDASLPSVFKSNHDLRELTGDPLLNYLVVLSGFHEDLASDTDINRNRIYARLLKDVLDRRHAKKAETEKVALAAVDDAKNRDNFERLLETVALAAWYGDGRTTTRAEIEKLLPQDLKATWQELVIGGPGFTRLIAAFYIRQAEGSAISDAIEFTHKSFGEYLTGRRLVREVARICKGRCDNSEYYREQQALAEWAKLTGAQAMTLDLLRFLNDEVALYPEKHVASWGETLTELFNFELRTGFPLSGFHSDSFREAEQRAKNAEQSILASLSACARVTRKVSRLVWPHDTSAGELINRLRGQRPSGGSQHVALNILTYLSIEGQSLMWQDLVDARLTGSILANANLHGAKLYGISAASCDLKHAQLTYASLCGADLSGAALDDADLQNADLNSSSDHEYAEVTSLREASLSRVNFQDADLSDTDFAGADLTKADFSGANVREANFSMADLTMADLSEASNLTEEQIKSARNITGATLPVDLKHLEKAKPRQRRGTSRHRLTP